MKCLLLVSALAAAPAPNQAALFVNPTGEWDVCYEGSTTWDVSGTHVFHKDGRGRAYRGAWWQPFAWKRLGGSIVVDYDEGTSLAFVLVKRADRLEGTATLLGDGAGSLPPAPVRFTKHTRRSKE
jgi:hypothetical protein